MFSKLVRSLPTISRATSTAARHGRLLVPANVFRTDQGIRCLASFTENSLRNQQIPQETSQNSFDSTFKSAILLETEKAVEITWDTDSETSRYPFIWLRDNCHCNVCFNESAQSRQMLISDLDLNVKATNVQIQCSDQSLLVDWSDGHTSVYDASWLYARSFNSAQRQLRQNVYSLEKKVWKSNAIQDITHISFDDVMKSDEKLLLWLRQLEAYGLVLIHDAPAQYGQIRKLAQRVAFIRRTHYGCEFAVKAKANENNVAYSSGPLQLHADLPYYAYKPGTQLVHCIVQTEKEGGDSLVVDAMNVALKLKDKHPKMFEVLANTQVDWCDVGSEDGSEFFKVLQNPIICVDKDGCITRINFSQPQRDSFFNIDCDQVHQWYEAHNTFYNMLRDPQHLLRFKMEPGTIQSFDNLRILHGRTSYEMHDGNRQIEGCYIDWDEVRSRRRVLEKNLNAKIRC